MNDIDVEMRLAALEAENAALREAAKREWDRVTEWLAARQRAAEEAERSLARGRASGLHYMRLFAYTEGELAITEAKMTRVIALAWQLQMVLREFVPGQIGSLLGERALATYREIFPGHGE